MTNEVLKKYEEKVRKSERELSKLKTKVNEKIAKIIYVTGELPTDEFEKMIGQCERGYEELLDMSKELFRQKQILETEKAHVLASEEEFYKKKDKTYDVFRQLFSSQANYVHISRLFEEIPGIVNLRNYKGNSLAYATIEHYIAAAEKEFQSNRKNSNVVRKEYFEQIFNLIVNNSNFIISKDERKKIDSLIKEFREYMKKYRTGGLTIVNHLSSFVDGGLGNKKDCEISFPEDFEDEIFKANGFAGLRRNSTGEFTFAFKKDGYISMAFSIKENNVENRPVFSKEPTQPLPKSKWCVKMHIIDVPSFIKAINQESYYSGKNKYFEAANSSKGELIFPESAVDTWFNLNVGEKNPVLTFELALKEDGSILGTNIYQNLVILDKVFSRENFYEELLNVSPEEAQKFKESYRALTKKRHITESIADSFEHVLKQKISWAVYKKVNRLGIPLAFNIHHLNPTENSIKNLNAVIPSLGEVSKKKRNTIYDILGTNYDLSYYVTCPDYVDLNETEISLELNPIENIIGLDTISALTDLYGPNNEKFCKEKNKRRSYISSLVVSENRKKEKEPKKTVGDFVKQIQP